MIKLLVISNFKSKELGDFLQKRGTFEIEGAFDSISSHAVDIQNGVLAVDKTLYLYRSSEGGDSFSNTSIREDMQFLQDMLQTTSFFNPGEIVFMTNDDPQCKQAVRYFMSVMKNCKYEQFSVKTFNSTIAYSDVYNNLLGVTENQNFKNSYSKLYRVERDADSSVAYAKQDDSNLVIEPFDFKTVERYEEQKEVIQSTASMTHYHDESSFTVESLDNPKMHGMSVQDTFSGPELYLLTGKSKSGLSTWASAMASSALSGGKKVLVIDYTDNQEIFSTLETGKIPVVFHHFKEMLLDVKPVTDKVNICSFENDREHSVRMNLIRNLFGNSRLHYDTVLIAASQHDFNTLLTLLQSRINKIFFTTVPRHYDVVELQKYVVGLNDISTVVILNDCMNFMNDQLLTQEQVKDLLLFMNPKVVKSLTFRDLNVGPKLFEALSNA